MLRKSFATILLFTLLCCGGCISNLSKKNIWTVSLKKNDKNPYGTYLTWQSLQYYFPGVVIDSLSPWFHYDKMEDNIIYGNGPALMVLVGLDFYISDNEMTRLMEFVNAGNELVIFSSRLDDKLENLLNCSSANYGSEEYPLSNINTGTGNIAALSLANDTSHKFGYEGRYIRSYYDLPADTAANKVYIYHKNYYQTDSIFVYTNYEVLGAMQGLPNFLRYSIGAGHITIHAAPLALSNYFLLQKDNIKYLDGIWQTLPGNISRIYWNEYFKHSAENSSLGVLLRYPATRWAFFLALFTLLVYVLFESKRRQRIIPVLPPATNTSVSFVETVGRLYYNKGNHANMAEKMVQYFLEWVRTNYFLNTNHLNDNFIKQLALRSGKPEARVHAVVDMIHELRLNHADISEAFIFQLYNNIQDFYKK